MTTLLKFNMHNASSKFTCFHSGILKGGWWFPKIFPKVPQSSLGILRVAHLPPPLEHPPPLRTLQFKGHIFFCLSCHEDGSQILHPRKPLPLWQWNITNFNTHDGSMGLVCIPTWLIDFYGKCREICQSHGSYGIGDASSFMVVFQLSC